MAAGQTQLVRQVEQLKQKAGNMVELETFTGLQVGNDNNNGDIIM